MSSPLLSRSPDLQRLQSEGYDLELRAGHLLIHDVPYVRSDKSIAFGILASSLDLAGNRTAQPGNHVTYWVGDFPCDASGTKMDSLGNPNQAHDIDTALKAQHTLSRRPQPSGSYPDYYLKMKTYVAIIEGQAQSVDASVTARPRRPVRPSETDSVFEYLETSSARAGIGPINSKMAVGRIGIVGLGGTGSYVLDLVAKTPIKEIHLFDGDLFLTHNAFRSPGAPTLDDLEASQKKVAWFKSIYSRMRRGIIEHDFGLDSSNVSQLETMNFVFLCMDAGPDKRTVVEYLTSHRIPFIEVGAGLVSTGESLCGSVRVTRCITENSDHARQRIPLGETGQDPYDQNIQVADINALNAALAVIRWKKDCGFYSDFGDEYSMVYSVATNRIVNDEIPNENPSSEA